MKILGIESSCDDTSVALIKADDTGFVVLAEKTASQIEVHKLYGGVVPEVAGRKHAENILPVLQEVMEEQPKPDVIAVTSGPGLITGLLVGVEAARTLSYLWDIPLVGVNHIDGHIHSVEISNSPRITFPALCLVVSGGHTELIVMKNHGEYERIGKTRDDAVGECFDKVAKLVGLEYPGGPKISKLASEGKSDAIRFPRPMIHEKNYDFSFAGLKTAALYWLRDHGVAAMHINPPNFPAGVFAHLPEDPTMSDFCASFEQAIVDVLTEKTLRAVEEHKAQTLILGGGVSANRKLRETLRIAFHQVSPEAKFLIPESVYCMDNAAMIAVAGYYKAKKGEFTPWQELKADPNWKIAPESESTCEYSK